MNQDEKTKIMADQLIGFEVAKLAKEKGFNIPVKKAYKNFKGNVNMKVNPFKIGKSNHNLLNGNCYNTSAPTQSLLQRWLREVHKVYINIYPDPNSTKKVAPKWFCDYTFRFDNVLHTDWFNVQASKTSNFSKTYEEALEKGLLEILNLI